ncbi:4-hydroxybenzoate 3-monooxygenase [Betaproteobacteria bacterium GR16-43]|nr:4-hydroxybenzoate 3-monooxygenase [Betaproteobacteria bacterium GR16-43]
MGTRVPVAIVGAGPAGLLLANLLQREGIESVVLESRSRSEIEATVRAGVLEQGTVDLLKEAGLGERLVREGVVHHGIHLRFDKRTRRIDLSSLTGGRSITLYAQHEVIKDLVAARLRAGRAIEFSVRDVHLRDLEGDSPSVRYRRADGTEAVVECDFIAGCDGYHGVSRNSIPARSRVEHTRAYPFGWFGILVEAPLASEELIYACHDRGFALVSTRSPSLQRLYFQCDPADSVEAWPDARIWDELHTRLETDDGWTFQEGRITQKNIVAMRSFVCETMRHGRLFLAGDAAHIVPPTGAKGLNLAVADVRRLAAALAEHYASGRDAALDRYATDALRRVWRCEHFSWWMTSMLHRFPGEDSFHRHLQVSQLEYLTQSKAAATALAENYVGLPWDWTNDNGGGLQ